MIREPTVLILGAGASAPYGLPTGWDLRRQILTGLNAQMFDERLSPSSAHPDAIAEFQQAFRQSGQYSIDAFLEHRVEYMEIGKRAIAATLLPQESTAALFNDPDDDWYKQLLQAMDAPWIQMNDNNIRFVTFNYDRSLEQFLATAFEHRYSGVSRSDAIRLVRTFDIVHVYGSLGSIDPADDDHVQSQRTGNVSFLRAGLQSRFGT